MPAIDYRVLRELVSIEQVLALIDYQPRRRRGDQLRGPCPIHDFTSLSSIALGSKTKTSRGFSVNVRKHVFQCFKCRAKGNQLDLWVACTKLPIHQAAIELCEKLGIEPPLLKT